MRTRVSNKRRDHVDEVPKDVPGGHTLGVIRFTVISSGSFGERFRNLPEGCDRCDSHLSGESLALETSNEHRQIRIDLDDVAARRGN